ncbi:phenylacetate--CoA ligase family protein [Duganella callida]|uniref:Phenylacetate--CoA ligase family protein n=1 Tax=Duganella callida TaxID=2561932 RepID=A0A4Y9SGQ3_9BURK|nr:AMP-binding protein [Duganella callida]TFW19391.1 phenylacetate--CoA ligase family protein [Duganella callida]
MSRPPTFTSDWYTALVSGALFPLHEQLKGHSSVALRRQMEESQHWPPERLAALRLDSLRNLLRRAATRVPYYRDRFAEIGFDPARDLHSVADLARLPLLDKTVIRQHAERLKAEDAVKLGRYSTGGSTGDPLTFYIGKQRVSHDVAAKWRATRWWGVDIGDPEIVIWGSPIELGTQDKVRIWRDRLMRTELISAFATSHAGLDHYVERIRAVRPRMLFGYPTVLAHIAAHAEERGQRMDDLGIRVAFVTSECLYDAQRAQIERVFGCGVANGYGGRDAGFLAHQCPQGGMHITAEDVIIEVLGQDGQPLPPGETGEIVVTHLQSGDFPFIRYRTGDVGALDTQPCGCGRTLPLLREIHGRTTDFLIKPDGTLLHSAALAYVMRDMPELKGFKIIQETLDLTRVQLVLDGDVDDDLRARVIRGFKARLGEEVRIDVEHVPRILPEKSGKYRYCVTKLESPWNTYSK